MSAPAPMNTAHQHAANAEEYMNSGLLVLAAEEHLQAADAYMAAIESTSDESAKRTLRLLHGDHTKAGKELQRKIQVLKAEGKDPNLPQKMASPPTRMKSPSQFGSAQGATSPTPQRPMMDSQNNVDESFMLLGGQRPDPGDEFNQFWNIMQGMLNNLSQPVAFATAPLGVGQPSSAPQTRMTLNESLSSDTETEEPIFSRFSRRLGMTRDSRSGTSKLTSPAQVDEFEEDILDDGDELSESFCLIPSGDEPSPAVLKKENQLLKKELELTKKRLETAERILQARKDQDMQLRDSIVQATREAQRVMGASALLPRPGPPGSQDVASPTPNANIPLPVAIPGINKSREAQLARRIRELEEELRNVRSENEKHKLMIAKFRERWEKLKESAKRKKEAKAASLENPGQVSRDRIVEEPDVEAELDGGNVL
ncbi:hypothetical protein BDN72DRAFT_792170 [Pluteus cervinus]|uniref:Uncharacterized protein n=1 Tax=Pluteus cervinus TaxID=181527 RepID=A0ACD3B6B4_9AGAR|nr:hypothetical protein BDN72DRAFT_792170 [Pluteus cervinus]